MKLLRFALLIGFLLPGCNDREPLNPLDPGNPKTGGELNILEAVAGNGEVQVRWDRLGFTDLEGLVLERTELPGGPNLVLTDPPLLPAETRLVDQSAVNGVTYRYTLRLLVQGTTDQPETNSELATPGPAIPWVVDTRGSVIVRLSPDGRDVVAIGLLALARGLAVTGEGAVWVADFLDSRLRKFGPEGQDEARLSLEGRPLDVAVASDGSLWIAQRDPDGAIQISPTGAPLRALVPVPDVVRVVLDEGRGRAWAASEGGVTGIPLAGGSAFTVEGIEEPTGLVVDEERGILWVGDAGGGVGGLVQRFGPDGVALGPPIGGFADPKELTITSAGEILVADGSSGIVIRLAPDGAVLERLAVPQIRNLRAALQEPPDGPIWLLDQGRGAVVRATRAGEVLTTITGFALPGRIGLIVLP